MADDVDESMSQSVKDSKIDDEGKVPQVPREDGDIVEGEVIEEGDIGTKGQSSKVDIGTEEPELDPEKDKANLIMQLEGLIKTNLSQADKLREELSEQKAMLKDSYDNDPTYIEHATLAKEANKVKTKTKAEIVKRPEIALIAEKVKTMSSELKELNSALSDYLREFNQQSGISQIEDADGELMEIVYVAKLVRKKA